MTPVAVLDANVLFPMILRDTLLRVAAAGCFRAHWTDKILDEMVRNLIAQHRITEESASRLATQMNTAFDDAALSGWEPLEANMQNDPKDRHVAAAAAHTGANVIVTANLKDFKRLPVGIAAIKPDDFLLERLGEMPDEVLGALKAQIAGYTKPPMALEDLLDALERDVPRFVNAVRTHLDEAAEA